MPHIILECSNDIASSVTLDKLGADIHEIFLKVSDTFKLSTLRTRVVTGDYYIGSGEPNKSFAHINIELVAGRSAEICNSLVSHLNEYLEQEFSSAAKEKDCLFSVELREINPGLFSYSKNSIL